MKRNLLLIVMVLTLICAFACASAPKLPPTGNNEAKAAPVSPDDPKALIPQVASQIKAAAQKVSTADSFTTGMDAIQKLARDICPAMKKVRDQKPDLFKPSANGNLSPDYNKIQETIGNDLHDATNDLSNALDDVQKKFNVSDSDPQNISALVNLGVGLVGDCDKFR